jgi:hypothetical protein
VRRGLFYLILPKLAKVGWVEESETQHKDCSNNLKNWYDIAVTKAKVGWVEESETQHKDCSNNLKNWYDIAVTKVFMTRSLSPLFKGTSLPKNVVTDMVVAINYQTNTLLMSITKTPPMFRGGKIV